MRKLLKLFIWLFIIIGFIYNQWIYIDTSANCRIFIIPSLQPSNLRTKSIIKLVKTTSPEYYEKLCRNVHYINKNPNCGGYDGGCYHTSKPNMIYLGSDQGNPALGASVLIHEICHVMQQVEGRELLETECYKIGSDYLEKVTVY